MAYHSSLENNKGYFWKDVLIGKNENVKEPKSENSVPLKFEELIEKQTLSTENKDLKLIMLWHLYLNLKKKGD